jgi:hypothetical protein
MIKLHSKVHFKPTISIKQNTSSSLIKIHLQYNYLFILLAGDKQDNMQNPEFRLQFYNKILQIELTNMVEKFQTEIQFQK